MIRIYKQSNNGEVGVLTDCLDGDSFESQFADALVSYIHLRDEDETYSDHERDCNWLIRNGFEILLKLRGYKSERISEQRMLFAGDRFPSPTEEPDVEV